MYFDDSEQRTTDLRTAVKDEEGTVFSLFRIMKSFPFGNSPI